MVAPHIITRSCCVCQRVEQGTHWVRISAHEKANLLLTHTYCPECFHHALADLHPPAAQPRPAAFVLACG
jgi:hypothetical protein